MEDQEKRELRRAGVVLIIILFLIIIIIFTTKGCNYFTNYQDSTGKDSNQPFVVTESSCWWGEANGTFTVKAKGNGLLCSGNSYNNYRNAYANPLIIKSNKHKIIVCLKGDEVTKVTMVTGNDELITCRSGSKSTYLYVKIT